MIAAWMAYSIAVTLVLVAAGIGAEHLARAMRFPTRFVWIVCIAASVALSARGLVSGLAARNDQPAATIRTVDVSSGDRARLDQPVSGAPDARPARGHVGLAGFLRTY